ncbi:MAG TPA: hypothetical protein VLA72_15370 [Anaerolineales bacterium]|nr:hypothetical protein [Anaerolineales bacterium]
MEAMKVYFSTSRPVWAVLYQITTKFIPQVPIYWQIFALFWRWLGVLIMWAIMRELWPGRKRMAMITCLLFLLYPGFNLQFVAFLSSHFYIVVCFFLLSHLLTLWSLRMPERFWLLTTVAATFSLFNLWMMEYFYFLELVRFFIILYALHQRSSRPSLILVVGRTFLYWLPYLLVFLVNVLYRAFVFTNVAYQNVLISELRSDPLGTLPMLLRIIKSDLWLVSRQAWGTVFQMPNPVVDGRYITFLYVFVALSVGALVLLYLWRNSDDENSKWYIPALWAVGIGVVAMVLGGGPYWLASLKLSLAFPASRFTLSFMLGVSLLIAGLLELFPTSLRVSLAILLIALGAGKQVMVSQSFHQDWDVQRNLFWQMTWRAPSIEPGTLILMNHDSLDYYADNSLSAGVNWIYAPESTSDAIEYVLFFPKTRLRNALPEIEANLPIYFDYIAGEFHGNTSQTLSFYYDPPKCLRLLDPDIERVNYLIPENSLMRYAARLTALEFIKEEPQVTMPKVYGTEPEREYCYYYQKADLARQFGRWDEVLNFSETALSFSNQPYEPAEQLVFIEGYAHDGQWGRAKELSKGVYEYSNGELWRMLCRLWNRIEAETDPSLEKSETLSEIRNMFACNQ